MSNEETIINLLREIQGDIRNNSKKVLTFEEFCTYAGISSSFGYKLTSNNEISFFRPHGKLIYLEREAVDAWLLRNKIKSREEIELETNSK
jgi:excisionase family DNA binding protein